MVFIRSIQSATGERADGNRYGIPADSASGCAVGTAASGAGVGKDFIEQEFAIKEDEVTSNLRQVE